ncbi:ABC transporter permease [Microbacterium sp. SLBN-146]|uniref:ABC transporter permease n=1 Tax=Microbacterium sp. SLBN-146 TaxID=2768457 RepID=UPI00114ED3FF|nr:ABC transporter permease [Microbacterium sp. SLBN-146]TQJ31115.1 ABC-2 type transport system permease protein [Microbacterium sp. SLBN-146]
MTTLTESVARETSVLGAVVARDIRSFWRYKTNIITVLVSALALPAAYVAQAAGFAGTSPAAIGAFEASAGTTEIAAYIYIGWSVYMWVSVVLWGPASSLQEERARGSLEVILLSPVSRMTLLVGSCIAQLIPAAIVFFMVGLLLKFVIGVDIGAPQIVGGVATLLASVPALIGIGAILSAVTITTRDSGGVLSLLEGSVAILCGVTYPLAILPGWLQAVASAMPPTETILLLRHAVLGVELTDVVLRIAYLLLIGIVLLALADVAFRRAVARGKKTGRLSQY